MTEAVRLFRPDLVIAPFLRRAIPEAVWRNVRCLIVHPGPVGDRGPAALDWAILDGHAAWGTTLIEANADVRRRRHLGDARFRLRPAAKSSLYRDEVTEAAVACVIEAIGKIERGADQRRAFGGSGAGRRQLAPRHQDRGPRHRLVARRRPRRCCASSTPRPASRAFPTRSSAFSCRLHDPWPEDVLRGPPGAVIARRDGAICRATVDGAVWITAITPEPAPGTRRFKIPATLALAGRLDGVPERAARARNRQTAGTPSAKSPTARKTASAGSPSNSSTARCRSTNAAGCSTPTDTRRRGPTKVIVLAGGREFWSNGMHLGVIEAAASPADASWANINAIDDVARAVLLTTDKLVIAALRRQCGRRRRLPRARRRPGADARRHRAQSALQEHGQSVRLGILDLRAAAPGRRRSGRGGHGIAPADGSGGGAAARPCRRRAAQCAARFPRGGARSCRTACRRSGVRPPARREARAARSATKRQKPLEAYRAEELERMRLAFYGFDPSYHVARWRFITREPIARTPLHLARHRLRNAPQA